MDDKISQNPLLEASWSFLGASWGVLGATWAHLGKKAACAPCALPLFEANLGHKIQQKSKKINVKKEHVLRYVFFIDFLQFCLDFGASKPSFLDQIWL